MTDKKNKDFDVPLVKLKEQPASLPAVWNSTCLHRYAVQNLSQSCVIRAQSVWIYISPHQRVG